MLKRNIRNGIPMIESQTIASIVTNKPISRPTNIKENSKCQPIPTPFSQIIDVHNGILNNRQNTSELHSSIHITEFNYDNYWQEFEIDLERSSGIIGLGFSFAGRTDTPCISDSLAVVITRITEDGLADRDQRLQLHDIISRVNYMNFIHIEHQAAADGLEAAGNHVNMLIRRLAPAVMQQIRLNKLSNIHLDFSIAAQADKTLKKNALKRVTVSQ